jgi:Leucine-rich repeat (LRR) protein
MINKEKTQELINYFKENKDKLFIKEDKIETSYDFASIGYYEVKENTEKGIKEHSYITDYSGEELVFINKNGEILIDNCNEFQIEVLELVYNSFIYNKEELENPTPIEVEKPDEIRIKMTSEEQAQELINYFKENKEKLFIKEDEIEISYDFADIGYYEAKENIKKGIKEHSYITDSTGEELVFINNDGKILIDDCNEIQLEVLGLVHNSFTDNKEEIENKSLTTKLENLNNKYSKNSKSITKKPSQR